ncbi:DHHC palmitoyltransferase-domain-containing protein [Coniella lustricola]|uniref:Palmitoyltransferase n=1 Tax=Coniella lustricola TaxID=2025994 RepID=A0A2T3ALB9_9PEZI|nr:DHHC palmitoyltransferase-domain-containing protein [Coniella lustricola]
MARWARRLERCCCRCATYFPLLFVYGLTTWAMLVVCSIGYNTQNSFWIGTPSSFLAVLLYALLNWSYTTAVFTPPGSTTNDNGYSTLPTQETPRVTSTLTVKSNGEMRFCKKCQARKPDRAHHCSTCRRCVLKMDHHCPWLATCIGLRNHKAFLLFLIYTSLFSFWAFAVAASWLYAEILADTTYVESLMPVNYIVLAVVGGIIALVVGAFTMWHIALAARGQTTIECLEKTRYLSPLRKTMQNTYRAQHTDGQGIHLPRYGQQLLDMHQDILPGVTRPEEGEELRDLRPIHHDNDRQRPQDEENSSGTTLLSGMPRHMSYQQMERTRARKRYEEYLDEEDSSKLPNAFDLGWKRNLLHLFGPSPFLWAFPICNTTGDGWNWEPSPKWIEVRDRVSRERDEQRARERAAGWGVPDEDGNDNPNNTGAANGASGGAGGAGAFSGIPTTWNPPLGGAGRFYEEPPRKMQSKADKVLGRDPNLYADHPLMGGNDRAQPAPPKMRRGPPQDIYGDNESLFGTDSEFEDDNSGDVDFRDDVPAPPSQQHQHQQLKRDVKKPGPLNPRSSPSSNGQGGSGNNSNNNPFNNVAAGNNNNYTTTSNSSSNNRLGRGGGGVSGLLRKASNNSLAAAAAEARRKQAEDDDDGVD